MEHEKMNCVLNLIRDQTVRGMGDKACGPGPAGRNQIERTSFAALGRGIERTGLDRVLENPGITV